MEYEDKYDYNDGFLESNVRYGVKYLLSLGNEKAYRVGKAIEYGFARRANLISSGQLFQLQTYSKSKGIVWIRKLSQKTLEFINLHPCIMKVRTYTLKNPYWKAIQNSMNQTGLKMMMGKGDHQLNEKN